MAITRKITPRPVTASRYKSPAHLRVVGGLAVTPASMIELTNRGIAVSAGNALEFHEGVSNPTPVVPLEQTRGIDVNDVWNAEQDARAKLVRAHKVDVQNFG